MWLRLPSAPPFFAPLDVSRYVILLPMLFTVIAWLLTGLPGWKGFGQNPLLATWALCLMLLALWAFASRWWAFMSTFPPTSVNYRPEVAQTSALQWGVVVLFALATACAGPSPRTVVVVLAVCTACLTPIIVAQAIAQQSIGLGPLGEFNLWPTKPGVSVVVAGELRWLRPYGLLPHPNNVGGYLAVGTLAGGALLFAERPALRWMGVVVIAGGLYALLLTFSRGGWLAFMVGGIAALAFLWPHLRRDPPIPPIGGLIVAALFIVGVFIVQYRPLLIVRTTPTLASVSSTEAGDVEGTEQRSVVDRRVFTEFAWRAAREAPLTGFGIGNFPWRASYYLLQTDMDLRANYVHNVYLAVLTELGIPGLALMLTALGSGFVAAVRAQGAAPSPWRAVLMAAFVGLCAVNFFDYYTYALPQFQVLWWGLLAVSYSSSNTPPVERG